MLHINDSSGGRRGLLTDTTARVSRQVRQGDDVQMLVCSHKRIKTLYNRASEIDFICLTLCADLISSLPDGRGPDASRRWSTTCRCVTASQAARRIYVSSYKRLSAIGDH